MQQSWEKHLAGATLISAVAFAVAETLDPLAGAAIAATAAFVALRPLFAPAPEALGKARWAP